MMYFACCYLLGFLVSCSKTQKTVSSLPTFIDYDTSAYNGYNTGYQLGCEEGQLYRYVARTIGAQAKVDDFCMQEDLEHAFVHQPQDAMTGRCQSSFCGMTTAARRAPIEYAMLQAVVSLERVQSVHLGSKNRSTETEDASEDISLYYQTVRFDLSPEIKCISKVEEYEEHQEKNTLPQLAHVMALERMRTESKEYVYQGSSLVSGSIFMEQIKKEDIHEIILIVESKYEEYHDSAIMTEKTLCQSQSGPIHMSAVQRYMIQSFPLNREEWEVTAQWRE